MMKQRILRPAALLKLLALVLLSGSLARAQSSTSSSFLRELSSRDTVTRADCMRAAAALVAGLGAPVDEPAVIALLSSKRIVRGGEARDSGRTGTRGFACLLFARALNERGGVLRHILPSSEHYAYRHLDFLDLIPAGGSGRPITGLELVSLLGLSRKRLARHSSAPEASR